MLNIVIGGVMAVAFVGMIVCAKKQNDIPVAKPLAIGLLLVVVICAIVMLTLGGSGGTETIVNSEMRYSASVPYTVGKKLSETMPGTKTLVVMNKPDPQNKFQQAKLEALKKGFGSSITDITYDYPNTAEQTNQTAGSMLEDTMMAKDLNKLLSRHRNCKLIVMLTDLPYDLENMKLLQQYQNNKKNAPKLALMSTNVTQLGAYIQTGYIVAVAVHNPNYTYEDKLAPETLEKAFNERYLLLTPKNVLSMAKKYPKLFPRR